MAWCWARAQPSSPPVVPQFSDDNTCMCRRKGLQMVVSLNQMTISLRIMMTSSTGNIFLVIGHLCGEFTGYFLWSVNTGEDGDLRRHHAHYDVIVIIVSSKCKFDENVLFNSDRHIILHLCVNGILVIRITMDLIWLDLTWLDMACLVQKHLAIWQPIARKRIFHLIHDDVIK